MSVHQLRRGERAMALLKQLLQQHAAHHGRDYISAIELSLWREVKELLAEETPGSEVRHG